MAKDLDKVDTTVMIAGKKTHFVSLNLNQSFNNHHFCEINIDHEEFDCNWMDNTADLIGLIGEPVVITMTHKESGKENQFNGIITNVSMSGYHGQKNAVIISGKSPTIKLDGKDTMDSFMDKPLNSIVSEAVGNSGNGGSVTANPKFTANIDYICQYNETCFEFLNRLSWLYGEWFFYDGKDTYFGKPGKDEEEELKYDIHMTSFNLQANLIPPKFNRYHYLHHDPKDIKFDAPDSVPGVEGYLQKSLDMSKKVYTSDAKLPLDPIVKVQKELEDMLKVEKTRAAGEMLVMSGSTQTCAVKIGQKVKIVFPDSMEVSKKEVDTFRVIQVTHNVDQEGHYSNTFSGIMANLENIPMAPCPAPMTGPQLAWVKSNADDDDKGRVKVHFQWQKLDKTTNWIRVQTPDAGPGHKDGDNPYVKFDKKVPENRGFVFIPEEGDVVMVGFEYGDPNRPYVMGSIFCENKSKGGKGKEENHIKTITTRTAHVIEFNDKEEDGWGITIKDYNGNIINLDTKGKNITITAPNTITMNATDIIMNATKSISMHSPDINIGDTGGDLANKTIDLEGKAITLLGGDTISDKAPAITINGTNTLDEKSKTITINGSTLVDITSALVKINA